jgi:predicted MFS family arabinose efflux permease
VGPVFALPDVVISLVYLAYVFGTVSAALVGRLALRWGRRPVLAACVALQLVGTALTLSDSLALTAIGVATATGGFFGAHTIGSGWSAQLGRGGTGASAGYSLAFYLAAGVLGWAAGLVYVASGWTATVTALCAALAAALLAGVALPAPARRR